MNRNGRPPKYETPQEMQDAIDAYFEDIESRNEDEFTKHGKDAVMAHPTVTGLALFLGFEDRHGLLYYEHEKSEFLSTIKRAKARIAEHLEQQLYRPSNVTGIIFNLKNNFGWKDQQTLEHKGDSSAPLRFEIVDKAE